MTKALTDIDIDLADRDSAVNLLAHVPASILRNNELKRHNVGVYLHEVPVDPITGLCSVEYKRAEESGFFKIDFLNVSLYRDIRDNEHLETLLAKEPMWELLEEEEIVNSLFHISGHFREVNQMKPKSVEQLAMVLAMIRPAKRYLLGKSWPQVEKEIWTQSQGDLYGFKKSHSLAYACAIVVQMNLIVEEALRV